MLDVRFREGSLLYWEWLGIVDNGVSDRGRDFVVRSVREADIQDGVAVPARHLGRTVNVCQQVWFDQFSLTQYSDRHAIAVKKIAMLQKLGEFDFGHIHQTINLILRPLEVLNAEGVNSHDLHAGLVTDFEHLRSRRISSDPGNVGWVHFTHPSQGFEAQIVAFYGLNAMALCEPPITVHDKSDMLRDWPLSQSANEEFPKL